MNAATTSETPEILTVSEVAKYLRIQRADAYKLLNEGKLPYFKLSPKRTRVRKADLEMYLEGLTVKRIDRD